MLDPDKIKAMQALEQTRRHQETIQNINVALTISINREKLKTGESSTAKSDAVVDAADRILLAFLNGLQAGDA